MVLPPHPNADFFGQPNGFVKAQGASTNWQSSRVKLLSTLEGSDPQMRAQQPASPRTTILCGLLAVGMGSFLVLVGTGVVKPDPKSLHGPFWVVACAGLVFVLAGISIAVGAITGVSANGDLPKGAGWWSRVFYYVIGLVICGGLAAIGSWVAFGPGPRSFSGTGLFLASRDANELIGRIVFGLGAVVTWLILLTFAVSGARTLFRRG